ncbi:MAG: Fe-S cluster protein [Desulfarculus sp.]|nr:Fe-S cluster protein [Desulfarculus sp.]
MLLTGYRKEIFRPECNPSFTSLHCHAHLDQDVGAVLPYLNAVLGGFEYSSDPPSLTLRAHGKLITLHPRLIAVNALKDEEEADKILAWLVREINQAWRGRAGIEPCYTGLPRPQLLEILKLLPRSNCRRCGQPTCMVFAAQAAEGGKGAVDCPELTPPAAEALERYLARFFPE